MCLRLVHQTVQVVIVSRWSLIVSFFGSESLIPSCVLFLRCFLLSCFAWSLRVNSNFRNIGWEGAGCSAVPFYVVLSAPYQKPLPAHLVPCVDCHHICSFLLLLLLLLYCCCCGYRVQARRCTSPLLSFIHFAFCFTFRSTYIFNTDLFIWIFFVVIYFLAFFSLTFVFTFTICAWLVCHGFLFIFLNRPFPWNSTNSFYH